MSTRKVPESGGNGNGERQILDYIGATQKEDIFRQDTKQEEI